VLLNGGTGGPGTAMGQQLDIRYENPLKAPEIGYIKDGQGKTHRGWPQVDGTVFSDWFFYNSYTYIYHPNNYTYVIKTNDNK
jgi:hypothetical protein